MNRRKKDGKSSSACVCDSIQRKTQAMKNSTDQSISTLQVKLLDLVAHTTTSFIPGENVQENMDLSARHTEGTLVDVTALGNLHRAKDRGTIYPQLCAPRILNQERPSAGSGKLRLTLKLVQKSCASARPHLSGFALNSIR